MKKRLLSALLALALVFVLLPTTALAETPAIKIAGTVIEDGKYYYTNGGIGELKTEAQQKTWNVRRDGNTLYLKNAKINTTDTQSIQVWMMSVTINLEGDSTITTKGEGSIVSQFAGSLTIKGNGKLTIESNTAGSSIVWNSGDVTITGDAVVNITNKNSGQLSEAIGLTNSYELTVSGNAKLKAVSNGSKAATVNSKKLTIADNAEFNVINQNSSGKAVSFKSIEVAAGYDCNGINGNGITDWTKTTAEELNTFQKVWVKPTPTPTLEKSNVYVAGTNLYKNTAYTIQNGKPVMGGTYPGNYNIYFDATDYVLHVKDAVIEATGNVRGTRGIDGTSDIVFEGKNSITASSYGIYLDFKSSDLKISGTGSLEVKTIAGDPAIATANNYNTSKSIIISGQGFTVTADTSETTSYAIRSAKDLTITDGAAVIAKSNEKRAIDIDGDLTVTNGSLKATSTSDSVPTVQVGGNASFTGSTVTITNHSTTQGKSGKNSYEVSTGLYVGGTLDIKNAAKVTSTVIGGNAIYAKGDITISGDSTEVNAKNSAYKFSAISTNGTVNISDNSTVKAENLKKHQGDPTGETDPSTGKTYNACPAITGKIANKNTQNKLHIEGFTTSSAGSQNPTEGTPLYLDIAPGSVEPYIHHYKVTITRGDEVTRTPSPVVIAGTTLLNDTYYTITNGSKVAEGTESNYNAFYDSATKTLKLNNAKISTTTKNAAIKISEDLTITVTGTNELKGNYNHCIESYNNFTINGTGTLNMTNTNSSSSAASVIYCGPYKNLTIAAEVIIKNEAQPGNLIFTVEENACSFAGGYNVYASTNVSGSPLETYDAANSSTYQYLRITKENLAPTTPTTYTVTITAGDNMKRESGALTQEVTKGAAITEVKFMAASGHYFPADYVSKMNLPAGLTAEIRENSWYLIISGTPTSDVTINLPAASVRPTITVSMPTPAAGNTPATASDITLTYSDINKSISKNLTISNVVWQSYVPNGDGSITPGEALSSGDKFEAGKTYFVRITHEYVAGDYDIVPAAGITLDYTESDSTYMMLLFYTTGAPCNHEYTNDWLANGNTHWHECKLCRAHAGEVAHTFGDWITDTPATDTTDGSKHRTCSVCQYQENATIPKTGTGEIVPPTPDNPGTIVIIRPAEEEKPAQQPNPSTGANDLVGLAVAAAVAAALGSAALLRKHD